MKLNTLTNWLRNLFAAPRPQCYGAPESIAQRQLRETREGLEMLQRTGQPLPENLRAPTEPQRLN